MANRYRKQLENVMGTVRCAAQILADFPIDSGNPVFNRIEGLASKLWSIDEELVALRKQFIKDSSIEETIVAYNQRYIADANLGYKIRNGLPL